MDPCRAHKGDRTGGCCVGLIPPEDSVDPSGGYGDEQKNEKIKRQTRGSFIITTSVCVCTHAFSLLCLSSTKTDKDAPKILSIGHKPYGPKTLNPNGKMACLPITANTQLMLWNICFRITNSFMCFFINYQFVRFLSQHNLLAN